MLQSSLTVEFWVEAFLAFQAWTLVLWLVHYAAHRWEWRCHQDHHRMYHEDAFGEGKCPWYIQIFGFQTTDKDEWIEQMVVDCGPTIIFSAITGHWWLLFLYWGDAVFISPRIDHEPDSRFWVWFPFAYGKFHTDHHENSRVNYGVYSVWWDWIFGTFKRPTRG